VQRLAQQLRRRIAGTGDHRRDAIDKAGARDIGRPLGQPCERDIGDEAAEILGQRHDRPPEFPSSVNSLNDTPVLCKHPRGTKSCNE